MTREGLLTSLAERPAPDPESRAFVFHRTLPGYRPSPLIRAEPLAARLGVGEVWVKQETERLGLPAFKILGASWATHQALTAGRRDPAALDLDWLRSHVRAGRWRRLAAASDGNHGRAVARVAALLDLDCLIFLPAGSAESRVAAIEREGATVRLVPGTYDDSVLAAAREASDECAVISDTPSDLGGDRTAAWVIEGYATTFRELQAQQGDWHGRPPDIVIVQVGTGGLAAAAVLHFRAGRQGARPLIVTVEPERAACAAAAARAGEVTTIPVDPSSSIMAGLNCGTVSRVAWPLLARGVDQFLTIADARAIAGMRAFAEAGIVAGETGAAGLGGLLELLEDPQPGRLPPLGAESRVLVLCTEGATDPVAYAKLVGRAPPDVG